MSAEKIIGNNIRLIREQKRIKQDSLAKHLGITKGRLSQIENGECKELTLNRIEKIALYLGVNFFTVVNAQLQSPWLTSIVNSGEGNQANKNFSMELIAAIATELAKRMCNA